MKRANKIWKIPYDLFFSYFSNEMYGQGPIRKDLFHDDVLLQFDNYLKDMFQIGAIYETEE